MTTMTTQNIASKASGLILLIEDFEETAVTYVKMLELDGYAVRSVRDGETGLREIEAIHPDAIMVDLRLPGMDGLEFLRQLRALDAYRRTPVAVVTGDYFLEQTVRGQLNDLDAELVFKPLWVEDMSALVSRLLTRSA